MPNLLNKFPFPLSGTLPNDSQFYVVVNPLSGSYDGRVSLQNVLGPVLTNTRSLSGTGYLYLISGTTVVVSGSSSSSSSSTSTEYFTDLSDTPSDYASASNYYVSVDFYENELIFRSPQDIIDSVLTAFGEVLVDPMTGNVLCTPWL